MTATPDGNGLTPSKPGLGPQATNMGEWERTDRPGDPPAGRGPPIPSAAPQPPVVRAAGGQESRPVAETAEATGARAVGVHQSRVER